MASDLLASYRQWAVREAELTAQVNAGIGDRKALQDARERLAYLDRAIRCLMR